MAPIPAVPSILPTNALSFAIVKSYFFSAASALLRLLCCLHDVVTTQLSLRCCARCDASAPPPPRFLCYFCHRSLLLLPIPSRLVCHLCQRSSLLHSSLQALLCCLYAVITAQLSLRCCVRCDASALPPPEINLLPLSSLLIAAANSDCLLSPPPTTALCQRYLLPLLSPHVFCNRYRRCALLCSLRSAASPVLPSRCCHCSAVTVLLSPL
jgi:hypothetical protein